MKTDWDITEDVYSLTIKGATASEVGDYTVKAENDHGEVSATVTVHINVSSSEAETEGEEGDEVPKSPTAAKKPPKPSLTEGKAAPMKKMEAPANENSVISVEEKAKSKKKKKIQRQGTKDSTITEASGGLTSTEVHTSTEVDSSSTEESSTEIETDDEPQSEVKDQTAKPSFLSAPSDSATVQEGDVIRLTCKVKGQRRIQVPHD